VFFPRSFTSTDCFFFFPISVDLISIDAKQLNTSSLPSFLLGAAKMEAQPPPALQLANTDGAGPIKRRRAALSCVECRRRKVRCDRQRPCGPCTKTKSPTCTFRPNARPYPEVVGRPIVPSTSASTSHGGSTLSSPRTSKQMTGSNLLLSPHVAPGIFGNHGETTLPPQPSSHAEEYDSITAAAIISLTDKVRDLEASLVTMSEAGLPGSGSGSGSVHVPVRGANTAPAGQFVKSKFYGESHWVNCIEPVRLSFSYTMFTLTCSCL
jgi:hypothetical protein